MKKVLQINSVINYGSTGRITEEIGQKAIKHGWESYIAYGRKANESKSTTIRIGNVWDVRIHGLQTLLFDRHGLASIKPTNKLIEEIKKINPDVVHLHNIHGYYINYRILFNYLKVADIPVVWTLHDCWAVTGHCAYFDYMGCSKWETQCLKCPLKTEYPSSYFVDRSISNYLNKKKAFNGVKNLTLVPVSKWLANVISTSYLSAYPTQIINNGINLDVFTPKKTEHLKLKYNLNGFFIILGVAQIWSFRKGLDDFIKLSCRLPSDCKIVLIGLNSKQLKDLPSNILGLPNTENPKQLAEFYSIADLYANLTWEDNFPTTNLEALACGIPVLTYNTGGSIEAVSKSTGFVIEKGDIESIVYAINKIKLNGKRSYSIACRERAVKLYNKEDRFQDYIRLYESISK